VARVFKRGQFVPLKTIPAAREQVHDDCS